MDALAQEQPELPAARIARYVETLGLSESDSVVLAEELEVARFFEAALAAHDHPKALANWTIHEVLRELKEQSITGLAFGGRELAELVALIDDKTISGKIAKEVFQAMLDSGVKPAAYIEENGLKQVTDGSQIEPVIDAVLEKNPGQVAQYREGKTKLMGFFVGQVMKETQGKANPGLVNEILKKKLD